MYVYSDGIPIIYQYIEDAMRRDTAAPSFRGWAFSCSVSASGACREMPADPLVDLGRSWGDLGRFCPIFLFVDKENCLQTLVH